MRIQLLVGARQATFHTWKKASISLSASARRINFSSRRYENFSMFTQCGLIVGITLQQICFLYILNVWYEMSEADNSEQQQ